jgi:hypothetical protein
MRNGDSKSHRQDMVLLVAVGQRRLARPLPRGSVRVAAVASLVTLLESAGGERGEGSRARPRARHRREDARPALEAIRDPH